MADNVSGIVLDIPPTVLQNIKDADKAIKQLEATSKHAANTIKGHFDNTMVSGVNAFIKKVNEAQTKLGSLNINVNIKDSGFSSLSQIVSQSLGGVSQLVQQLSQIAPNANLASNGLGKISDEIKKAFPYEAGKNIDQLSTAIDNINKKLRDNKGGVTPRADEQYLVNLRARYQEELRILNQSDQKRQEIADKEAQRKQKELERNSEIGRKRNEQYHKDVEAEKMLDMQRRKAFDAYDAQERKRFEQQQQQAQRRNEQYHKEIENERLLNNARQKRVDQAGKSYDNAVLSEQNKLLNERLKIQKQLGNLAAVEAKNTILGNKPLTADQMGLKSDLLTRIGEIDNQLSVLGTKYDYLGEKARRAFDTRNVQGYLAWQQETIKNEESIAKARAKANELITAQSKAGLQPTTEELSVQRQLAALYTQKLGIEKEIQQVNNQITLQGRGANAAQQQYLTYLNNQTRALSGEISTVSQGYAKIEQAANNKYMAEWLRMQERAAYDLAQAQEQVNKARQRDDVAKKLSEYKALVAENERLSKAMRDYVKAAGSAPAITDTSASAQAYRNMEAQWQANEARRRQISAQNITEIAEFERQMQLKAYQDNVNAFIQAEVQKKNAAIQRINEESAARKAAYDKYTSTYEGAVKYAAKDTRTDTYEKREIAIKKVEAAIKNLSTTDSDYANKLQRLTAILNTLKNAQKAVTDEINKKPAPTTADAFQAIAAAKAAKSLSEYQKALEKVKTVMSTMNVNDPQWAALNKEYLTLKNRIDEIRKKMGEFKSTASSVGDVAGQLARTLAATFSVSAITGYINKMIQVRAQFELQQTALRAILQNKDEADRIFMQVQQMALQSPFSIMQMTTFTKQLAAYRIESEKLVGTTKMLADVSAGLGVDMGRLILAYGQVKAANYLRATEVRQFTEAGLNIAGELAQYFSELQGKMISVGDVMDMITKRMVRFEDVEEVFKRVTSAGGLFYDMQKKQSETLWGQLQRIKDAMSIMFNEIGKSNQGAISDMLTTIRALISNWRTLAIIAKSVGGAFATWFVIAKGIPAITASIRALSLSMAAVSANATRAAAATKLLGMTNPYSALATVVASLAIAIYQAASAQSRLNEELERVKSESISDMNNAVYRFKTLADTVTSATKSYQEIKQAQDELKRSYGDILPAQELEIDNLRQLNGNYENLISTIRQYYDTKAREKQIETINTEYAEKYIKAQELFVTRIQRLNVPFNLRFQGVNVDYSEIMYALRMFYDEITERVKDGSIKTAQEASEYLQSSLSKYFGKDIVLPDKTAIAFAQLIGVQKGYADETERVLGISEKYASFAEKQEHKILQDKQTDFEKLKKAVGEYETALRNLYALNQQGKLWSPQSSDDQELSAKAQKEYNQARLNLGMEQLKGAEGVKELNALLSDQISISEEIGRVGKIAFEQFNTELSETTKNFTSLGGVKFAEDIRKEIESIGGTNVQKTFNTVVSRLAKVHNVGIDAFNGIKVTAETSFIDIQKQADDAYNALEDRFNRYKAALSEAQKSLLVIDKEAYARSISGLSEEQVKMAEALLAVLKGLSSAMGGYEKASKSASRQKDVWTPRLNLMQKVNKEYEKLLKYYSQEEAMAKVRSSYSDAVAEAFKGTQFADISSWGEFDAKATIDNLRSLAEKAAPEYKKKFLEAAGTLEAEIEIKVKEQEIQKVKDEIQKAFDNYELTKTLGTLGLNVDLTYMVGGKPMTLEQIRQDLEQKLSTAKTTGGNEELVKTYEEYLRKITDMENKAAVERLKNYGKYITRAYSDAATVQLKYFSDLEKMQGDFARAQADLERRLASPDVSVSEKSEIQRQLGVLPQQARRAAEGMRTEMEKELSKLNMDALFKDTMFSEMFQDLGKLTGKTLDQMLAKIKEIQDGANNLSLSQVRQLAQAAEKISDAKIDTSSFKEAFDYVKKAYELRSKGITPESASDTLATKQLELDEINKQIENLNLVLGIKEKGYQIDEQGIIVAGERVALDSEQIGLLKQSTTLLNGLLAIQQNNKNQKADEVKEWQSYVDQFGKAQKASNRLQNILQKVGEAGKAGIDAITSGIEAFGGSVDDSTQMWLDFAGQLMDSCISIGVQIILLGVQINTALGIIGLIATALTVVAGLFKTILGAGDAKKEKQIKKLKDKVDDLKNAYEDLGEAIDNAYKFNDYKLGYEQSLANLKEQEKAYREMIRLEEDKKKTDKDKIKDYQDALRDIEKARKQLQEDMYEDWGSVGDSGIRSEAENFVSAWLDAYKETGDGLDGLKEHWDEFFENLVMKQAAQAVVSARMQKYIKQINAAIESGQGGLSLAQTFAQIGQNLKSELGDWNEDLKAFFEAVGIKGGKGELLLSDLQKGIQNITEPQAAAIEAYLNSMRFAVFEQNNILTDMLAAIQAQYSTSEDSPMLSEVKAIRTLVASIDERLSRVIVPRNSAMTSYVVKVN